MYCLFSGGNGGPNSFVLLRGVMILLIFYRKIPSFYILIIISKHSNTKAFS